MLCCYHQHCSLNLCTSCLSLQTIRNTVPAEHVALLQGVVVLASCTHVHLQARKPVLYVGGGCLDASRELREFVKKTGIPVASTLMGLGVFPDSDDLALQVCFPNCASLSSL